MNGAVIGKPRHARTAIRFVKGEQFHLRSNYDPIAVIANQSSPQAG